MCICYFTVVSVQVRSPISASGQGATGSLHDRTNWRDTRASTPDNVHSSAVFVHVLSPGLTTLPSTSSAMYHEDSGATPCTMTRRFVHRCMPLWTSRSLVDRHDQDRRLMWVFLIEELCRRSRSIWIPKIRWKIRDNDWNETTNNEWKFTIVIIVLFDHRWSMTNDEDDFHCLHVNSDLRASSAVQ